MLGCGPRAGNQPHARHHLPRPQTHTAQRSGGSRVRFYSGLGPVNPFLLSLHTKGKRVGMGARPGRKTRSGGLLCLRIWASGPCFTLGLSHQSKELGFRSISIHGTRTAKLISCQLGNGVGSADQRATLRE